MNVRRELVYAVFAASALMAAESSGQESEARHRFKVEAFAVVLDPETDGFRGVGELHSDLSGLGVTPYISKGLLADTKEGRLDV